MIFTSVGSQKDVVREMKSTSMVNLRRNIIATGLMSKFPTALIYTAKGAFIGSVKKMSKKGRGVYVWQGKGDKPYKCKTDGMLILKGAPKAVKPKVVPKAVKPRPMFGNKFLDEHIIIATIPKFKGRV